MTRWIPTLIVALQYVLDKAAKKGLALSTAATKRNGKVTTHFHMTDYDERCKDCMPDTEVPLKGEVTSNDGE